MDPLAVLRDFVKNKKDIKYDEQEGMLVFDNLKFSKDTPTVFRASRGKGEACTLGALWFQTQNADLSYGEYRTKCKEKGFPIISRLDKGYNLLFSFTQRAVISYLTGGSDGSENINSGPDFTVPLPSQTTIVEKKETPKGEEEEKSEPDLKKQKIEDQDAIIKRIRNRERVLHTRSSVLQSKTKHFTALIDSITAQKKREEREKREEATRQKEKEREKKRKAAATYDRYGDVQEDKFWKDRLGGGESEEFQIDTRGTFADMGRFPDAPPVSQPKPETPRPSISRRPKTNSPHTPRRDKNGNESFVLIAAMPLVIVPGALTSLLTMYNVQDFLVKGTFETSMDKKNSGTKKETSMVIERKNAEGVVTRYQIVDNTAKLSSRDWDRVIAVFVLGAAWQFKDWKWTEPVDLFSNVLGFFLHYEEEKVPENVQSWDVRVLNISRQKAKRHLAQTASLDFWNAIDHFLRARKPDTFAPQYYQ